MYKYIDFVICFVFFLNASFDLHNMHVLFADHKSLPCSPIVRYLPAHSEDTQVNTLPTESDSNIDGNIPLSE